MRKSVLILKKSNKDVFFKDICGIEKYYCCSFENIFLRIWTKFKLPFISVFFEKWKKNLKNYRTIILFDNGCNKQIFRYIKKKNKNAKIIFWYWNSLVEYNNNVIQDKNIDEIWTYNRFDAEKYNLKYNPQFYHISEKLSDFDDKIENDIIFMGRDKGREKNIEKTKDELEKNGLKCNFKIIKDEKDYIDYNEYLEKVLKAKCIFDFSYTEYNGLSLRPLEALFYKKKLITNNKDIVNYNFYKPNNIFVLGLDNMSKIREFIDSPYEEVDEEIVNYYDFESWLKRFEENQNEH